MLQTESFVPLNDFERQLFTRLVPEDHFLRRLERTIDFERFRPTLAECYAPREGRPALDPVMMQPSSIDQLNQGPNVYGRQYKNCYYAGQWIGACAMVVNSDMGRTHPMPWTNLYHHTLVLSGGDILDGGTASTNGPAPPSLIGGPSAIIAIQ